MERERQRKNPFWQNGGSLIHNGLYRYGTRFPAKRAPIIANIASIPVSFQHFDRLSTSSGSHQSSSPSVQKVSLSTNYFPVPAGVHGVPLFSKGGREAILVRKISQGLTGYHTPVWSLHPQVLLTKEEEGRELVNLCFCNTE